MGATRHLFNYLVTMLSFALAFFAVWLIPEHTVAHTIALAVWGAALLSLPAVTYALNRRREARAI